MARHLLLRLWLSIALCSNVLSLNVSSAWSEVLEPFQQVRDLRIYIGVIPARIAQRHPSTHPEASMHGKASASDMHLVVAVFDSNGKRIETADVTASVSGLGHTSENFIVLEPMKIAETITFCGFVRLSTTETQNIEIEIRRPGIQLPHKAIFSHVPAGKS